MTGPGISATSFAEGDGKKGGRGRVRASQNKRKLKKRKRNSITSVFHTDDVSVTKVNAGSAFTLVLLWLNSWIHIHFKKQTMMM